jgi:adenine-specific DNA-methyltransferase
VAAEARVTELLTLTASRALTAVEREELAKLIGQAAHARVAAEPWLEWTGTREKKWFEVDPVALHIHERISAQAILKVAARQDVQRSLFADPQQAYHQAVQFYQHDIDWANRLILGDSLSVMSSLAKREDLAGKVQMIYIDPPYGIKFASNFQPEIGKRDVKDKDQDLTREPEMVKAYRDTWNLGIHSYLSYLRDRLVAARELLADTGSIFVQISDENLHRVRALMRSSQPAASNRICLLSGATICSGMLLTAKSKSSIVCILRSRPSREPRRPTHGVNLKPATVEALHRQRSQIFKHCRRTQNDIEQAT